MFKAKATSLSIMWRRLRHYMLTWSYAVNYHQAQTIWFFISLKLQWHRERIMFLTPDIKTFFLVSSKRILEYLTCKSFKAYLHLVRKVQLPALKFVLQSGQLKYCLSWKFTLIIKIIKTKHSSRFSPTVSNVS